MAIYSVYLCAANTTSHNTFQLPLGYFHVLFWWSMLRSAHPLVIDDSIAALEGTLLCVSV